MVGQGGEVEAQTFPVIVYSREMGQYAERCGRDEVDAAVKAFGVAGIVTTAIRIVADDVRHAHHANGDCITVFVRDRGRNALDMRTRMGRAFIAGHHIYVG